MLGMNTNSVTYLDVANAWNYVFDHTDEIETAIRHNADALIEGA